MNDQLRRRAVGAPAARSLLLTVLGEYVQPYGRTVWQETLIAALGELEHKEQAARQALARSVSAGWLTTERHGRRSRVTLTPGTATMLATGAERIYGFGEPWSWDGRWLLVALRVPEERREVRHKLRTRLAWDGFGSLGGGLWISPHLDREDDLAEVAAETGAVAGLVSFRAELGSLGDPAKVIADAWDLDAVADGYREFVTTFARARPKTPAAVFKAQTLLVHAWRRFPFVDPDLPEDLLPRRWPKQRAHDVFVERHEEWGERAQAFFGELDAGLESSSKSARTASK